MTFFKILVISTMVITLATAWSGQFPQFYQTFPSRTAPPIAFRPFFQEPFLPQRYLVRQPQFRQPLEQYQPQFRQPLEQYQPQFRQPLEQYQPPTPPPTVIRPNLQPSRAIPTAPPVSNQVTTTGVHHHVYYYYFYLPLKGETPMTGRRVEDDGRVTQQPCGDHRPMTTAECPPVYLPPPSPPSSPTPPPSSPTPPPSSPTPPISPTTQSPSPTASVPPQFQGPCNDDTVVIDNVDYYPSRRMPIVVGPANSIRNGSENLSRDISEQKQMLNTQPNFILANYLLPPDK